MKQLNSLLKFYQFETAEEFFIEMSNCLEAHITMDNYEDYLSQFESSYNSWLSSYEGA